ncbi:TP53-regulated inhibitor of apoptosis 1-like [Neocloeon triangulifer]|uniref:TP53-regulated inhibitor of apoptosis 1-like n=1 Tax=Neocloeon triangulifer TaxID=2078957 RepID=UPI00286F559B|nr:TP53-regulated inhibitor of apoptosis 1-like [Neocloeon triangulifer]
MNSVGEECNDMKKTYDSCFNAWFSHKFLRGQHDDQMCADLFLKYQQCVKNAMKQQNISIEDVQHFQLGTEEEKKAPPKK